MTFVSVNGSFINVDFIAVIYPQFVYNNSKKVSEQVSTIATRDGREYSTSEDISKLIKRLGVNIV